MEMRVITSAPKSRRSIGPIERGCGDDLGVGNLENDGRLRPGIYFLWVGETVVYVGQSVRPMIRAVNHLYDKRFERSTFINVREIDMTFAESYMIWFLQPAYNRDIPKLGAFGGNYGEKASAETISSICSVLRVLPGDYVLGRFEEANQQHEQYMMKHRASDNPRHYVRRMQRANRIVLKSYKEATDGQ